VRLLPTALLAAAASNATIDTTAASLSSRLDGDGAAAFGPAIWPANGTLSTFGVMGARSASGQGGALEGASHAPVGASYPEPAGAVGSPGVAVITALDNAWLSKAAEDASILEAGTGSKGLHLYLSARGPGFDLGGAGQGGAAGATNRSMTNSTGSIIRWDGIEANPITIISDRAAVGDPVTWSITGEGTAKGSGSDAAPLILGECGGSLALSMWTPETGRELFAIDAGDSTASASVTSGLRAGRGARLVSDLWVGGNGSAPLDMVVVWSGLGYDGARRWHGRRGDEWMGLFPRDARR